MRTFFFLTSILFVTLGKAQVVDTCLIINEISMKPCCGLIAQKTREYVEIFNTSNTDTIDINGWFVRTDLNNTPLSPLYGQDEIVTWSSKFSGSPNDLVVGPIITNSTKIPPRRFAVIFSPQWNTSMINLFDIADSTIALTLNNFIYWGGNGAGGPPNNGLLNNSGDFVALFNANPLLPASIQIDSIGWNGVQSTAGFSLQRDDDCVYRFYKDQISPAVGYNVDLDSTLLFANSPGAHNTAVNDTSELLIITSDDTICMGGNILFSYTEPYSCTSFSYLWNFGDPISGTADTSSSPLPNHIYNSAGNHVVSLFVTSGCFTDTIYTSIKVNANIAFSQSQSICFGQSVTVGSNVYNVTGTYSDTLIAGTGCDSVVTTNLTINPISTSSNIQSICQGDSILLGGSFQTVSGNYNDTIFAGSFLGCDSVIITTLNILSIANSSQNVTICQGQSFNLPGGLAVNSSGTFIDTLQNTAFNGCDSIITTNLTVSSSITLSQSLSICFGQSVTVGSNIYNAAGTYIDTLISFGGCDSIVTSNLVVKPIPSIDIGKDTMICLGETLVLSATITNATYLWQDNSVEPTFIANQQGVYWVKVTINGCSTTDTIVIIEKECTNLIIPNVITPNGDGQNDFFFIDGLEGLVNNLKIYSRWGNLIYEEDNYQNKWNARTNSGNEISDGTYFYILTVEGSDRPFTGFFNLFH